MTDPIIHVPEIIKFTDNAAYKVAELIFEEENLNLKLRAYITGGGCSGFQYGFTFDEKIEPDDTIIKKTVILKKEIPVHVEVILLIDPMSIQYLAGANIDYKEDLGGARFIIEQNPNAKTTCGCGQSFSVEEED